jgi:hypothetical protein
LGTCEELRAAGFVLCERLFGSYRTVVETRFRSEAQRRTRMQGVIAQEALSISLKCVSRVHTVVHTLILPPNLVCNLSFSFSAKFPLSS